MRTPDDARNKDRRLPFWLDLALCVAVGVALAALLRTFVGEVYEVPSGSMLETIQEGDRLWGNKIAARSGSFGVGDVVTFDDPEKPGVTLIKRVVATGGQVVDLRDGLVYVDGQALDESAYTLGKPSYALKGHAANLAEDIAYPYTVPEGCVWVMGDNRTNSLDSRYFGAVSEDSVTSKAELIFWPPSDFGAL